MKLEWTTCRKICAISECWEGRSPSTIHSYETNQSAKTKIITFSLSVFQSTKKETDTRDSGSSGKKSSNSSKKTSSSSGSGSQSNASIYDTNLPLGLNSIMPAVRGDGMRGLAVFISDIRNCKSKEAEIKRINKELANIRSKFKGDKTLDGYQKKKYVCKLLFIFLLGHDIDFGHMEAVNLLSSNKYTEKQIGYLFISVLISQNSDLINLINQSIKNDLTSRNPVHVSLALQCIANIGSKDMAEVFAPDIPKLLVSG